MLFELIATLCAGLFAGWVLLGGGLLGLVIPFTLLIIRPTNQRLLDPGLERHSAEAAELLARWGRLHAILTAIR